VRTLASLLLSFFLFFGVAQGQGNAPDATAIIQRAGVAMGCNTITPTTTIALSGHIQASSLPASMAVSMFSQGNSRWRAELDTPKEHKVTIVNSGKGQIQHADGHITPLSDNNSSHQRPMYIPCLTNLALPPGAVAATYLRTETINADSFDVIELLPSNHPSVKWAADRMKSVVWISRASGTLAKLQYFNAAEQDANDTETVEIDYLDYRVIDGLAVPFHQVTVAGKLTINLQIDSVQLNGPAADFQLR
jgi:hypothetical protein